MHSNPDAQSVVVVQLVLQRPAEPHVNGEQSTAAEAARHVPAPSQLRAAVARPDVQAAGTQTVPTTYFRQPPLPSQAPSAPQLAAPWSAHWPRGSWPAGTLLQRPSLPATAHDWQAPAHAVVQQVPCSQWPDAHSPAAAQRAPGALGPQLPLTHARPGVQSASVAQVSRHLPSAPQAYAPHEVLVVGRQAPTPSHTAAKVSVAAAQDPG
jgi:hypothetical protein